MLSRFILRTSSRICTFPIVVTRKPQLNPEHAAPQFLLLLRPFSSNSNNNEGNNGGGGNAPPSNQWNILNDTETSSSFDRIFADRGDAGAFSGIQGSGVGSVGGREEEESCLKSKEVGDDVFKGIERADTGGGGGDGDGWLTAEGYKPWTLGMEEEEDVFDIGESVSSGTAASGIVGLENEEARLKEREKEEEEKRRIEAEEKQLTAVLKGSILAPCLGFWGDVMIGGVIAVGHC